MPVFAFMPRWKEELVCTGPGGAFVLDLTMGVLIAYLPTQDVFQAKAPAWAAPLWPMLKQELAQWCLAHGAQLAIDATAGVYDSGCP